MKGFGKVLVALGIVAAGAAAILKIIDKNSLNYTEVEFEELEEEQVPEEEAAFKVNAELEIDAE